MKVSVLFLVTYMLFCTAINAQQTVSGKIINDNENALSNVIIRVKGTDFKTFSNQDGTYSIIVPSRNNILRFSLDTYTSQEVKISGKRLDITLVNDREYLFDLSLDELLNIKVTTAGKIEQSISDIPSSVVVITRADIETMGYKNVMEALGSIPGLFPYKSYLDQTLGVRGFLGGTNIILLVNNVNQHGVYNIVPIEAIDRIEVVRGPKSVMYGTGAFLGVINIITKQTCKDERLNIISSSAESISTYDVFGKFAECKENMSIAVNASYYTTEGLNIPYNELIEDPSRLPILGVPEDMTTENQLEREKIYFNLSTTFNNFYFDLTFLEDYYDIIYFFPSIDDGSNVKKAYNYLTAGYRNDINEKLTLDFKLDYFKRLRSYDFNFNLFGVDNAYFSEEYKESGIVAEFDVFYKISPKINLTTGLYSRIELEGTDKADIPFWGSYLTNSDLYFVAKDDNAYTNAIFSKIQINPFKNLIFYAGIRLEQMMPFNVHHDISQGTDAPYFFDDKYEGSDLSIIPSFALIYSLKEHHIFKLLYGEAVCNPTIQTLYSDLWAKYSSGLEREHLMPEKLKTIEFNYITTLYDSKLSPSISVYRNYFTDMILKAQVFNESEDKYYWLFSNYGKMITTGVEFTLFTEPIDNFKAELSYTRQNTIDELNKEIAVGNSPKSLAYMKLSYSLKDVTIGITGNYVDKMDAIWSITNNERIANSVSSYYKLGANLRVMDILNSKFFLNFHVSNILDQEIRYTSNSNEFSQLGYIGEARSYRITAGYKF
ncbi:MAG: TonB-dependent receptor [Bacteroidales bacterium]|nr:TonB-dependent receptor [Bacteroidales bacterium]